MIAAFRQGWRSSAGFGWIVLLAAAGFVLLGAMMLVVVSTGVLAGLGAAVGDEQVVVAIGYVVTALIGGFAWSTLAVLRVAAYLRTAPKQGM